ncbi:DinB family protein [Flavobacterium sp. '19STA2R22 D10 B1']|uniref:DinB family protein n=1 Tax=Flavobacterium aerium TaxID=3037261 RepID=UPI00278C23D0|nr:DUF1572 family protein [Flavobacterium sp. '19STA2R22 D10 B1']
MQQKILKALYRKHLEALKLEISSYQNEKNLWIIKEGISNSGGNLCLHLIGNLNTFIGGTLGNTGYVRYRDLEFSQKDVPRETLLEKIDEVMLIIDNTLDALTDQQLRDEFPTEILEKKTSTAYLLTHLTNHLTYHLGQINYHRRLLDHTN